MNRLTTYLAGLSAALVLTLAGCGSSYDSTKGQEAGYPPPVSPSNPTEQPDQRPGQKTDTLNVDVQNAQKPPYDQNSETGSQQPSGRYSVQIGAYKMSDNAERVAALARERFGRNVYTIPDKASGLYKVMVGDFAVKDDARRFRDEMVQKYPSDYKDAWVSENPSK